MNKSHSKVWNKELGQLVVASEFARSDSAGVVQGAGAAALLRRSVLALVVVPLLGLAGFAPVALAQEVPSWELTDGDTAVEIGDEGTVTVSGDSNITVEVGGSDNAGSVQISLNPSLDLGPTGSLEIGETLVNNAGVAIGATTFRADGLSISGGPSVTTLGINAAGRTITNVGNGTVDHHAVNLGQLNEVRTIAQNAGTAAGAGWNIASGTNTRNIGPDGTVTLSGDTNVSVSVGGTDDAAAVGISLNPNLNVTSVNAGGAGGTTLSSDGLRVGSNGPRVTSAGIDAGGLAITNMAPGQVAEGSMEAITGHQVYNYFIEEGATGVRYFRAASTEDDSVAAGLESVAIGPNTVSAGGSSFAAGDGARTTVSGEAAIALGQRALAGGAQVGGEAAIAIGRDSVASGDSAVALGDAAQAGGGNATALGAGAVANGGSGIAVGDGADAAAQNNISIGTAAGQGTNPALPGDQSHNIAIGNIAGRNVAGQFNAALGNGAGSGVEGDDNVAFGRNAGANIDGEQNVSIGLGANSGVESNRAVGIGAQARAQTEGVAIGFNAQAGSTGVAVGRQSTATGTGTAIGPNSHAAANYVALGLNSRAAQVDVSGSSFLTNRSFDGGAVSVGSSVAGSEFTRRIVNVEDGANATDAVNVRQLEAAIGGIDLSDIDFADGVIRNLQEQIDQNMLHYVSINDGGVDQGNRNNNGADADAIDSIAIGPDATTKNPNSVAIGHMAGAEGDSAVVLGHNIKGLGANSTTIGNSQSEALGESGIAIGTGVESRDENSIVIGRDSYTNRQASGPSVENSIVIGTESRSTAVEGIVIGRDSVVNAPRGIAQGSQAHATAGDAMAFGTRARASGASSQASGTRSSAHRENAIASGTDATGWAIDGIALGSEAVAGFEDPANINQQGNTGSIAIGTRASAVYRHALALGVDAHSDAESSTAIGDSAEATAEDALAVGSGSLASAQNASAFGQGAEAVAGDALAVGPDASASAAGASAFGRGAQAAHEGSVALGAGSVTAEVVRTPNLEIDGKTYTYAGATDGVTSTVSIGQVGAERTITNVAAGRVSATSTDAINGSQLYGTNMALEELADNLDTAGESVAVALGGNSFYDPDTHTVSAGLSVRGNNYANVQDALTYVGQGWTVSAQLGVSANVAPGDAVDFRSDDRNIVVNLDGSSLVFDLSDELDIGSSITIGGVDGTVIDGGSVTTNDLAVTGDTSLGDHFTVNDSGVYYTGPITDGDHLVNKTYVDGEIDALATTPLTFAGDSGSFERVLGETVNVVGGADIPADLTDGNIGVVAMGADTLEIRLNKDINLGPDGSLEIGGTTVDGDGLDIAGGPSVTVDGIDAGGEVITNVAPGEVSSTSMDAINGSQLFDVSGSMAVAIGGDTIVNPDGTIMTSDIGNTGHDNIHDAIDAVNTAVNAGWNLTGEGADAVNVGPDGSVDFQGDQNIIVAQTGVDQEGVIELTLKRDLDVDSVTAGDSELNTDGLVVKDDDGNETTVAAGSIDVADVDGHVTSIGGTQVDVGGANTILIDGNAGTIEGLANVDLDGNDFAQAGRAATEEQLDLVNQTANAGWNVSVNDEGIPANVAPGGTVDFSNDDGNIVISRDGTALEFNLDDDIQVANSITVDDNTTIDGAGVRIGDDVHLGDTGLVITRGPSVTVDGIDAGGEVITNVAAGEVSSTSLDAINGRQLFDVSDSMAVAIGGYTVVNGDGTITTSDIGNTGHDNIHDAIGAVNTAANAGWNLRGSDVDEVNIGPDGSVDVQGDRNIGVAQTGVDQDGVIQLTLNRELDVDSVTAGDSVLDTDGLVVTDDDGNITTVAADGATMEDDAGNVTTVAADGSTVADGAGNSTAVGAGTVAVTDAGGTTTVGGTQVVVGGTSTITIDGNAGTIGGLTNQAIDYLEFADGSGRAATEEQLDLVNQTANAGWNLTGEGANEVNIGPGGAVDFQGDANISVAQAGVDEDGVIQVTLNRDLDVDSVTAGDSVLDTDGLVVDDGTGNVTTVAADGTTVEDASGSSSVVGAGTVEVTEAGGTTIIGGSQVTVGGTNTIVIDGNAGTIGGLANTTFDPDNYTSGQAATEDQLRQVSDVANAGWNVSVDGEGAVAGNNVGPGGTVDFSNTDGNIEIDREGTDLVFDLADDITVDSVRAGDTSIDTTGVAVGADVHLGNTGLVINGGPSVTITGINAGNMVITNVAPGEISATSTDAINGSQLHGMGDSIVDVIGGNAELNPDGTITTSDIGGTGHDNIDDAIRSANEAANAGWTATDADGNAANIGPGGSVNFTGDGNISVAQTGEDDSGEIQITLNRDLDVDSITAGNTVVDTDGVRVGDDVHLGDTGLVIDGGPSVTTDGIDAGGSVISNVADGVADSDAANVGQLNQVAADVVDLGDRMDVVEGDVSDLQAGAAGPFQVSQEAPIVPPTPTGTNSAAGGSGADASGDNATALGNQAVASGDNSTAVGQGAQATHGNSVALGQGSATTVGAQSGYDAAYVGSSTSAGEVNVGNRTISGVAPGVAGNDAVNVNQLNAGVNHAVVTANDYTDQRFNQVQGDVWHLHGRVDDLEKSINSGVASAMAMRQAPYVAGATTYYAGFGAYKDQGALGVSLRRTADNGRWSLEGGFSANRDGTGGYIGVSGVLGSK